LKSLLDRTNVSRRHIKSLKLNMYAGSRFCISSTAVVALFPDSAIWLCFGNLQFGLCLQFSSLGWIWLCFGNPRFCGPYRRNARYDEIWLRFGISGFAESFFMIAAPSGFVSGIRRIHLCSVNLVMAASVMIEP